MGVTKKQKYQKQYRLKNKDRIKKEGKKYRLKNRNKLLKYNRNYYRKHKIIRNRYNRKYYKKNKDILDEKYKIYRNKNRLRIKKRDRKYQLAHKKERREYYNKHKRQYHQKEAEYRFKLRTTILKKLGMKCVGCGDSNIFHLQIGHKYDDGNKERKFHGTLKIFREYITGKRDISRLQCQCANCNVEQQLKRHKRFVKLAKVMINGK